ncbi:MAG: site-2 protease family protein [Candidatus Aenigmatarchaeota archaeon]
MIPLDYETLNIVSIVAFIVIVALLVLKDRKKFQRDAVLLVRRTQRGKELIIRLGRSHPTFFRRLGNIGVVIGFIASIITIILLIQNLAMIATSTADIPGAALVLPTISTQASIGPGYFAVPFWYWIISIALLILVHEGFHGVFFAREKLRIKSMGVGLLVILPLAFVEEDRKEFEKLKPMQRLRILAAGSFANFMLAGLAFLVLSVAFAGAFVSSGVSYSGLIEGYPAHDMNLTGVIVQIDHFEIRTSADLSAALEQLGVGQTIDIYTEVRNSYGIEEKTYSLTTVQSPFVDTPGVNPDKGFIGIIGIGETESIAPGLEDYEAAIFFTRGLVIFIFLLNLFVGMFNVLPLPILDGGQMWNILFKKIAPKGYKLITKTVYWIIFLLIVALFVLPILKPFLL